MADEKRGFIAIDRSIQEHWIWAIDEPYDKRSAWIDLIMMANWQDAKIMVDGSLMTIKRGQRLTSEKKLATKWKWSRTKVRSFLDVLQADGMITVEKKPQKYTVITIENYSFYQDLKAVEKTTKKPQRDHRETTERPQKNINNHNNHNNQENQERDLMSGKPDGTDEEMRLDDPSCEDETRTDDTIETTRKSESKPSEQIPYKDIIEFLNETTGKGFKYTSKATQSKIHARWQEGFRLEDFKRVVLVKSDQWRTDPRMSAYLRPDTLFGTKFESYLNEINQQPRRGGLDANTTSQYTTVDGYDPRAQRTSYGRDRKLPRLEDITKLYEERALERARDVQGGAE